MHPIPFQETHRGVCSDKTVAKIGNISIDSKIIERQIKKPEVNQLPAFCLLLQLALVYLRHHFLVLVLQLKQVQLALINHRNLYKVFYDTDLSTGKGLFQQARSCCELNASLYSCMESCKDFASLYSLARAASAWKVAFSFW